MSRVEVLLGEHEHHGRPAAPPVFFSKPTRCDAPKSSEHFLEGLNLSAGGGLADLGVTNDDVLKEQLRFAAHLGCGETPGETSEHNLTTARSVLRKRSVRVYSEDTRT